MRAEQLRRYKLFPWVVVILYLSAIVLANGLLTTYGQKALPWIAFCLIPFDLVARDVLQDRWQDSKYMSFRLSALILLGGCLSVLTGTGSLRINVASFVAFTVAGFIDALTYQAMIKKGRIFRINAATILAAINDSIIFVVLAFAFVDWYLIGLQVFMKVLGGFVWSLLLYRFFQVKVQVTCWLCTDDPNATVVCDCHNHAPGGVPAPCNLNCNKG